MRRAFTLVELIIYMGIFAVMLVVLAQIFEATLNLFVESTTNSSISRETSYLASRMTYDIRRATDIQLPVTTGETGSVLQLLIDGETFVYQINEGRMTLTENGVTEEVTGNDVEAQSFVVTKSSDGVQVGWTLVSGESTQSYLTSVTPR
jgi:hypothetical protein